MDTQEIRTLWDQADEYDQLSNEIRWQVAEAISVKLSETGISQRSLAKELGRGETHIRRYRAVWERFGDAPSGRTFSECMSEVRAPQEPEPSEPDPAPAPVNQPVRPAPRPSPVDVPPMVEPVPGEDDDEDIVERFNREVAERRKRLGLPVEAPAAEQMEGQLGAITAFYNVTEAIKDAQASITQIPELIAGHSFNDDVRGLMCDRADWLIVEVQMVLEQLRNPISIDDFFNAE